MVSPAKPSAYLRGLVLPVYLPSLLFSIGESGLIPLIPANAQRLGADIPTAALVAGLVLIGTLVSDIPAARFVNRVGERKAMIWAGAIAAISILAAVFATNLWMMSAGVFVLGGTAAVFGLARHAFIAEHAPIQFRARALSFLGGMFRLGSFLGPLIGAVIIELFGLEHVYWMTFIFCGLAAVILLFTQPEKMPATSRNEDHGVWGVAKREKSKLVTIGVASMILTMVRTARFLALPLWALHINLPISTTAVIIGVAGAVDFALFYNGGQVIDKVGRRLPAIITTIAMGLGVIAIGYTTNEFGFTVIAVALAVANAVGSGLVLTIGADLAPPDARNEFLATFRLMTDGGIAAAAPAISILTALTSLAGSLLMIGGVAFIGAWMMWRYLPKFGVK